MKFNIIVKNKENNIISTTTLEKCGFDSLKELLLQLSEDSHKEEDIFFQKLEVIKINE